VARCDNVLTWSCKMNSGAAFACGDIARVAARMQEIRILEGGGLELEDAAQELCDFYVRVLCGKLGLIPNCFEPESQRSSRTGINVSPERLSE
jgi:hypothetical protein